MKAILQSIFLLLAAGPASLLGHFYTPERLAFPALCEKHFTDPRKYTTNTWIEPVCPDCTRAMAPYLKYLPKPYEADCYGCSGCGGMRLSRREEFCLPFDNPKFAYNELTKLHQQVRYGTLETCRHRGVERCESFCWDGGYFRRLNKKYFPFFKNFLIYSSQNVLCKCFWHERTRGAAEINNLVYRFLYSLAEQKLIRSDFSSFWASKEIRFDRKGRIYGKEYFPNSHGMASSLATYAFFYSHYEQILKEVMPAVDQNATDVLLGIVTRDQVYQTLQRVHDKFLDLYTLCLSKHPHPIIFYERSLLYMQSGDMQSSLADLKAMLELSQTEPFSKFDLFISPAYQRLGETYAALNRQEDAIEALNQSIVKDPNNAEAYFLRASVLFEKGDVMKALDDYHVSKKGNLLTNVPVKTSAEFRDGLLSGLSQGGKEQAEFFACPSGWQRSFWAEEQVVFVDALQFFANACEEAGRAFALQSAEGVEGLPEEALQFFLSYLLLGDTEKGERLGTLIGKYGVCIFSGGQKIKQVDAYKRLQEANRLCNLAAVSQFETFREALLQRARS
ncbi:MAG: tetratricopeptide repeat protein [Parachlamydia sp.]|nr:tetratricopeptide repeat protein [Parachlamydia sp.]